MPLLLPLVLFIGLAGLVSRSACAQIPASDPGVDEQELDSPLQRWLPMPIGDTSELARQAQLLQQLRDMVVADAGQTPFPGLTPDQLKQMQSALQQFQDSPDGVPRLPAMPANGGSPSVPSNSDLTLDPALKLLERYARERSLPTSGQAGVPRPGSSRQSPTAQQLPRSTQTQRTSTVEPRRSNRGRNALVERSFRATAPEDRLSDRSLDPFQDPRQTPAGFSDTDDPQDPSDPAQDAVSESSRQPNATGTEFDPEIWKTLDKLQNSGSEFTPYAAPSIAEANPGLPDTRDVQPNRGRLPNESRNRGETLRSGRLPQASGTARGNPRPTPASLGIKNNMQPASDDSQTANAAIGIEEQIERYGLGATLHQLVRKTLAEQGANENPSKILNSIKDIGKSFVTQDDTGQSSQTASHSQDRSEPRARRATQNQMNTSNKSGVSQPQVDSESLEGYSALASDIWKAISTSPSNKIAPATPSSDSSGSSAPSQQGGPALGMRGWFVLLLIASCGLGLLLAGRRQQLIAIASGRKVAEAQARLTQRMRTRADIVQAFHRCVLQRPQLAASWWTHAQVARQLREASPHLELSILELTEIYERARYLPSHVELSADQIQRAQVALQQCFAGET